ncbi:hypothetical protein QBC35DRAFT_437531 [Podospora australis]|uniref:Uncharacterized protein n=1 Tax=Podospora australis TaxID=1536484 RepID=A0AAN7AHV3_9PEZI|nr:hypothetical protein QBC35DRAFT_437531 [Podospora australis]
MGQCSGKEHEPKQKGRQQGLQTPGIQREMISRPSNVTIQIPRNRASEDGVVIPPVTRDMDSNILRAALDHVSNFVAQKRRAAIEVIAVGGAVNTLHLRTRETTHDIDVFGFEFGNTSRIMLDEAMYDAQNQIPALGTDWLNTETQMWMPGPIREEITQLARKQGVKVYDGSGLTILAAPWEYAFTAKINRILTDLEQVRPYDLADAVAYLHEYITRNGNQPVPVSTTVQKWAQRWNLQITQEILRDEVAPEYLERYRRDGIVF